MTFRQKIEAKKFIVTSEIAPPKGVDLTEILDNARMLKPMVDAINVTDLQNSVMRAGSMVVSSELIKLGIEPIFQMTCRDRNRLALQSDLLSAYIMGIRNVLILTGDYTTSGDHPEAKPVFDLGSAQLMRAAKALTEGVDMKGNALKGSPSFCLGAVVNPGADPIEPEIIKMENKASAGASFFQTQAVYDVGQFKAFREATRHIAVPVFAGIVLLKSAGMARFMNKNVAGVNVPDAIISEMENAQDKGARSVEIAARLITELKPHCDGIHIMPIGWDKKVPQVLKSTNLT